MTVSTGVGAGIISNGTMIQGENWFAGEVGHIIINPNGPSCSLGCSGCLEGNVSGTAIASIAKEKIKKDTSIYLVDTFGELHIFYSIADFIFIGGSFVDHGGQNPIEAAFYGKIINHGKNIQTIKDL